MQELTATQIATAMTNEEAHNRLAYALKIGDQAEIEKWDRILRNENDHRLRVREMLRQMKVKQLEIALKNSYRL